MTFYSDLLCVFFFQAEDGIRDIGVTGVQTCALPIFAIGVDNEIFIADNQGDWLPSSKILHLQEGAWYGSRSVDFEGTANTKRSEERRVGKECRSRWSPYH